MQVRPASNNGFKLPKIDRPTSKNQPHVQRTGTKFPSIKLDTRVDTNHQIADVLSDLS
jgi:hypothetical protein